MRSHKLKKKNKGESHEKRMLFLDICGFALQLFSRNWFVVKKKKQTPKLFFMIERFFLLHFFFWIAVCVCVRVCACVCVCVRVCGSLKKITVCFQDTFSVFYSEKKKKYFIEHCMPLSSDSIPNVRMKLCDLLLQLKVFCLFFFFKYSFFFLRLYCRFFFFAVFTRIWFIFFGF